MGFSAQQFTVIPPVRKYGTSLMSEHEQRTQPILPGSLEAPVILWDSIQAMGIADGLAHMTLCLGRSLPDGSGNVVETSTTVAHLRMSFRALAALGEAIAKIDLIAKAAVSVPPSDLQSRN
jgi:hypothetical protein